MTDTTLEHYGIIRKSGRYPWGSGKEPYQRSRKFMGMVHELRQQGLSDSEIAKALKVGVTKDTPDGTVKALKQNISIARNQERAYLVAQAKVLREKGLSPSAIGTRMGINESSVRTLLDPSIEARNKILNNTVDILKTEVDDKRFIDISGGIEAALDVPRDRFNTAVAILVDEGYQQMYVSIPTGVGGNETTMKVLAAPGESFAEIANNPHKVQLISAYSENKGETIQRVKPPVSIGSNRIKVVYGNEGGSEKDGLIEIRPGVKDLDMGSSNYAQVRILVDDSHFLKGVAVYRTDMPPGVDILYNTPKSNTGNKHDAMKPIKGNERNPFGSYIRRQKPYVDENGETKIGALNIISEEGDWHEWNKSLSSQMMSKQRVEVTRKQLGLFAEDRKLELDEIKQLNNEAVKKMLLQEFADKVDSDAADLKAMGLPGTRSHVIIPIPEMKNNEVYAPNYDQGQQVVLIRHPHGGIFEIPQLVVNNKNPAAIKAIGKTPIDAIGINARVAEQLSGADFDGDTVLVIPNDSGKLIAGRPIESLIKFNPKESYPPVEGMRVMRNTQNEMGKISNLITDMSVKGAPLPEIIRAVKHSMVVIDAEKHELNYQLSAEQNNIAELKKKYQPEGGASTIISRANADVRLPELRPARVSEGRAINPKTGELNLVPSGNTIRKLVRDKEGNIQRGPDGKALFTVEPKIGKYKRMSLTNDARTLMSSVEKPIEREYASHANRLKALANEARLEMINTPNIKRSPQAAKVYKAEVDQLKAQLNLIAINRPLERRAQAVANAKVRLLKEENPDMDKDQVRKARARELDDARAVLGASRTALAITPRQWEAIQAGAISHTPLLTLLNSASPETIREYATPRDNKGIDGVRKARAMSMLARDFTQAEIAKQLGVSVSTIAELLKNN